MDIARQGGGPFEPPFIYNRDLPLRDPGALEGRYYLRHTVLDHPGVLGRICTALGEIGRAHV